MRRRLKWRMEYNHTISTPFANFVPGWKRSSEYQSLINCLLISCPTACFSFGWETIHFPLLGLKCWTVELINFYQYTTSGLETLSLQATLLFLEPWQMLLLWFAQPHTTGSEVLGSHRDRILINMESNTRLSVGGVPAWSWVSHNTSKTL